MPAISNYNFNRLKLSRLYWLLQKTDEQKVQYGLTREQITYLNTRQIREFIISETVGGAIEITFTDGILDEMNLAINTIQERIDRKRQLNREGLQATTATTPIRFNWAPTPRTDWTPAIRLEPVEIAVDDPHEEPEPFNEDLAQSVRDLTMRYADCLTLHLGKVIIIERFDISGGKIKITYAYVNNGTFSAPVTEDYDDKFQIVIPKLGYINTDQYSLFLERQHRKSANCKYKRGFHTDMVSINSISDREILATGIFYPHHKDNNRTRAILSIINDIFIRQYPSYDEALEKVTSFKTLSCAFSSTLAIKLDSMYNRFLLIKNKWVIAEYQPKKNNWKILNDSFNEELDRYNIKYEV